MLVASAGWVGEVGDPVGARRLRSVCVLARRLATSKKPKPSDAAYSRDLSGAAHATSRVTEVGFL